MSFDNGPDPEITPQVLDILARRAILTTFFVVGDKLRDPERYAIVERAFREGHWIGNHTFNHLAPLGVTLDVDAPALEIGRTQELIGEMSHPDRLFRPFGSGGILDEALLSATAVDLLCRDGYTCVLWNVVPRDWENPKGWVPRALEQCAAEEWPLVVLHDLPTTAMEQLELFLDGLEAAGATIVQHFPEDCVPIVNGGIVADMSAYMPS
ncbi:polysaccharide deacetylase family protein [Jiella pacifica]|uniref:polysaccharide deacetylase family protein n=1 Tax=Jiella pacifica TaxID=2696469 RepID=UPI001FE24DB5|nr:polysaccharide deacetylase family protein [Jiella pacifica]